MYYASAIESKFDAQASLITALKQSEKFKDQWTGEGHEAGWSAEDEFTNWFDLVRTLPDLESLWWAPKLTANLLEISKTFPSDSKISPEGFPIIGNKLGAWCFFDSPAWYEAESNNETPGPIIAVCWQWGLNPVKAKLPGLRCQSYTQSGKFIWPVTWAAMEFNETLDHWRSERAGKLDQWMTDDAERLLRFVLTAGAWLQQKLLITPDEHLNRIDRKRLKRNLGVEDATIKVVYLRRQERTANGPGEHVEWNHRWLVSGHWRNQFYPSLDRHMPIYINPYIKGPEDKPIIVKHPKSVFAVVR